MINRIPSCLAVVLLLGLGCAAGGYAQSFTLRASILSPGGERSTGDGYTLYSTLGQAIAGPEGGLASSGDFQLGQGFWYHVSGAAGPLALPTASDDAVTTDEDTPVAVAVLGNDTDPGGGTLTITDVGTAEHGTVEQTDAATLTYTPEADFFGADSFVYQIRNEQGGSAQATVTVSIQPVNDAPAFTTDPVRSVTVDTEYSYTVETADVDGDAVTITATTRPAWLTLTDHGDGTATLAGTPTTAEAGEHDVVLAVNDGTVSTGQAFTVTVTAEVPGIPTLLAPEDGAMDLTNEGVMLAWSSVPGAATYGLDLSLVADFSSFESRIVGISDTTWTLYGLAEGTTYFWRIQATNAIGSGAFSETFRFMTALTVANESETGVPAQFALHQNYPNPFNPTTTISYELAQAAAVRLVVFDLFGRAVKTLVQATQSAGRYSVPFEAGDLASGTYFYRIEAGAFSQTRQLVLLK